MSCIPCCDKGGCCYKFKENLKKKAEEKGCLSPVNWNFFVGGKAIVQKYINWDRYAMAACLDTRAATKFYEASRPVYRLTVSIVTVIRFALHTALEPVIAVIALVVTPVIAMFSKNKDYRGAAAYALCVTAANGIAICFYVFVFSQKTAIILGTMNLAFPLIKTVVITTLPPPSTFRRTVEEPLPLMCWGDSDGPLFFSACMTNHPRVINKPPT